MNRPNLQLKDLVELTTFVATHWTHLVEAPEGPSLQALQMYWRAGRERNHQWLRLLQQARVCAAATSSQTPLANADDNHQAQSWSLIRRVAEEIFVSEMLTRLWTAVLIAWDDRQGIEWGGPIGRSVFIGHLEARRLCLQAMINAPDLVLHEIVTLDRVRRQTERWSDVLLGPLCLCYPVTELAFSVQRAQDFAYEAGAGLSGKAVQSLLAAGLTACFSESKFSQQVLSAETLLVASSILACFPSDAVASTGELKSSRLLRLFRNLSQPDHKPRSDSTEERFTRQVHQTLNSSFSQNSRATEADSNSQTFPTQSPFNRRNRFREM